MSNSLVPVRLPFLIVGSLIGCRDEALFAHHAKNLRKALEQIDENLEDHDDSPVDAEYIEHLKTLELQKDPGLEMLEAKMGSIKTRLEKGESVEDDLENFMEDIELFMSQSTKAFHEAQNETPQSSAESESSQLPDARTVMRHMFFGEPVDARIGFAYNAVTMALCRKCGAKLPNQNWIGVKRINDWAGELDKVLVEKGVHADLFSVDRHLLSRGNPFLQTYAADVPFMGYLTVGEIANILPRLEALNLKSGGPEDPETYLIDIRKWLKTCANEEEDLICFTE